MRIRSSRCSCDDGCRTDCPCKRYNHECSTTQRGCKGSCLPKKFGNVFVALSQIPKAGKGLFALRFIESGTVIGEYTGPLVSREEITDRGREFGIYTDFSIDGAIGDSLISYINHSDEEQDLNAEFFINEGSEHPRVWARTTKPVQVLTEIFLSYGKGSRWDFGIRRPLPKNRCLGKDLDWAASPTSLRRKGDAVGECRLGDYVFVEGIEKGKIRYWRAKLCESVTPKKRTIEVLWIYEASDLAARVQASDNPYREQEVFLSTHRDIIQTTSIDGRAGVHEFQKAAKDGDFVFWERIYDPEEETFL